MLPAIRLGFIYLPKLTAHHEWLLQGDDFEGSSGGFWPSRDPRPASDATAHRPLRLSLAHVGLRCPEAGRVIALEAWYNHGYTEFMKTAISIPDFLFEEADRLAKRRGWSRSELYANAVTAYVNSERFSGVREKLDAVYGNNKEDSAIDPFLADAQARSLPSEKW